MTSVSSEAGEPRRSAAAVAPGERGAIRIADRVVAKIAAQAAREAVGPRTAEVAAPQATVTVHHETARVRVHLELDYPTDIGARCAAVRRHVAERVGALVGMEVPEVAVHVERLHLTHPQGTEQGRTR
ncbi:Asp23/Gls24 family envelope stress response protein [Streptomyces sp. NPDC086549]|uniref:Asp23/Gls24 family envelope stress response protein n=1 Tax=Streptomyces sp. NPDC086549 TaxID=3365752 RepID=UPI0038071F3B